MPTPAPLSGQCNGRARRAGLRERDIVVRFGGKAIVNVDDLHRLLTDELSWRGCEVEAIRGTDLLKLVLTPEPRAD
ncbi:MAG: hypothetical protein WA655_24620 [Candidatus Korobacteraceae bacterium]